MITLSGLADVISGLNVSISDGPWIIWGVSYKCVQLGVWCTKLQFYLFLIFCGLLVAALFIIGGAFLGDYAYSKYSGKPMLLSLNYTAGYDIGYDIPLP